jgi:hypothetical protein
LRIDLKGVLKSALWTQGDVLVPNRFCVPLSWLQDGRRVIWRVVNLIATYRGAVLRGGLKVGIESVDLLRKLRHRPPARS